MCMRVCDCVCMTLFDNLLSFLCVCVSVSQCVCVCVRVLLRQGVIYHTQVYTPGTERGMNTLVSDGGGEERGRGAEERSDVTRIDPGW